MEEGHTYPSLHLASEKALMTISNFKTLHFLLETIVNTELCRIFHYF